MPTRRPNTQSRKFEPFQDMIARLYPVESGSSSVRNLSRSVTFQVTDSCNLACSYCYQTHKGTKTMPFAIAKQYVDLILSGNKGFKEYVDPSFSKAIILEFIGGEPFLEVNLIDKIIDYFMMQAIGLNHPWAKYHAISICSNGTLYGTPDVQKFLAKYKSKLSFSVTLDGDKTLHDSCRKFPDGSPSYDLAEYAVTDWMNHGGYMGSKITISKENLPYMVNALKHFMGLGFVEINANCVFEADWNVNDARLLYKNLIEIGEYILKVSSPEEVMFGFFNEDAFKPLPSDYNENWCGGTGQMLACDPDGYLFPCIRYMHSSLGDSQPPLSIGDVYTGLAQCEKHKNCVDCLNAITRKSQSTKECFDCPIAEGCAWCSGYNYQVYGTPNKRVTKICIMHKARALANCWYWNTYYRKVGSSNRMKLYVPKEWALEIITEEEYNNLLRLSQSD